MKPRQAWILAGPTAVGKSAVAHELAQQRSALVLCADAMTVYRGMDIGTAKPDSAQRAQVQYFGLDLVDPDQPFSVGAYLAEARRASDEARKAERPLIVVGGSGLYISALLRGLDTQRDPDPERRAHWEALLNEGGVGALQSALKARDPGVYARLADPQNPRRLIRALERLESGDVEARWNDQALVRVAALRMDSERLRARIHARARGMFEHGLVEEAKGIRARWPTLSVTAAHAMGYAESFGVLDGSLTVSEAVARTATRTWQLARRQMTWFRHQLPVSWVDVKEKMELNELASAVRRQWEQDGPSTLHI